MAGLGVTHVYTAQTRPLSPHGASKNYALSKPQTPGSLQGLTFKKIEPRWETFEPEGFPPSSPAQGTSLLSRGTGNSGPEFTQFFFHPFVATIQVVNSVNLGRTASAKTGNHQRGTGP